MPSWTKMYSINSASPIMEQLILFHDYTMIFITSITTTVLMMTASTTLNKILNRNLLENQVLETTWTIIPAIILIFIATPSLKILYMMEELMNPSITIKTIGHQWYWSYEYSDKKKMDFESFMMPKDSENKSTFRLLDVDNRLTIPFMTKTRLIVSSSDVIHSWTIPALGLKMDAVPGRLNQMSMLINKPGLFFGQCSEICGTNHSFMPIVVESTNMKKFISWINKQ
nr:cytochrome c oxidase subunit II [Tropiduchidae sp. 1 WQW-2023a]